MRKGEDIEARRKVKKVMVCVEKVRRYPDEAKGIAVSNSYGTFLFTK